MTSDDDQWPWDPSPLAESFPFPVGLDMFERPVSIECLTRIPTDEASPSPMLPELDEYFSDSSSSSSPPSSPPSSPTFAYVPDFPVEFSLGRVEEKQNVEFVQRRRYTLSAPLEVEERKVGAMSKRDRNRESAAKYRLKRKARFDSLEGQLEALQQRLVDLGKENCALRSQISVARKVMHDRNIPFEFEGC